ncbi:MAG: type IV pili methyl-accepting chemotaxis transducer N-terminal domain-containing protein [Gammaproteobacteria bacterium]|nr:type IV pili methyl-accepting chemotaxis transducer N-terminal domain-containing protein [Gammaproteobacteria bacterium]
MINHRFHLFFPNISAFLLLTLLILSSSLIFPDKVFAEASTTDLKLNTAINRAGLQRMLTQKILKFYCQIGQDQFYNQPEEKMQKALAEYEEGLEFLVDYHQISGVQSSLIKINQIWPKYKTLILSSSSKENIPELIRMNEKLLKISHKIVMNLEAVSNKTVGKIVNISGRQRMLSQRIELFYLLQNWGFEDQYYLNELAQARKAFSTSMSYLNQYEGNTEEVKLLLAKAQKSFNLFEHSLEKKDNAFLISLTVRQLLKYMNDTTIIYSSHS